MFRYHRQTQVVANASAALNAALGSKIKSNQTAAVEIGVPLAKEISAQYSKMITLLLEYGTTPGTLGMLGAHEGANWPTAFGYADAEHDSPDAKGGQITRLAAVLAGSMVPPQPKPSSCRPHINQAGCFKDNSSVPGHRCMPHMISIHENGPTQEICASQCAAMNYTWVTALELTCYMGGGELGGGQSRNECVVAQSTAPPHGCQDAAKLEYPHRDAWPRLRRLAGICGSCVVCRNSRSRGVLAPARRGNG